MTGRPSPRIRVLRRYRHRFGEWAFADLMRNARTSLSAAGEMMPEEVGVNPEDTVLLHVGIVVRPAYRPSRWAWYAVDCENGEIVEYAFEYDSPLAARRAGLERLHELASCLGKPAGGTEETSRVRSRRR